MSEEDDDKEIEPDTKIDIELKKVQTFGYLETLRRKRVCLYPGVEHIQDNDVRTDFWHCLPLLDDCNALIVCMPQNMKDSAIAEFGHYTDGTHGVSSRMSQILYISEDFLLFPNREENLLAWTPHPDGQPQTTRPPDDRFWADYIILSINDGEKNLHLLCLGLRGDHVWPYFLVPNSIPVARIISSPIYH